MAQLMLVNPARRRKARKASPKRARRASSSRRRVRRAANPVATIRRRVRRTRRVARNPIFGRRRARSVGARRRRRNPISMRSLSSGSLMKMLKQAAVGGLGIISMDMVMAQVNKFLPPSLQPSATGPGLNDLVRVLVTVVAGKGLSKMTKGASETAAAAALAAQAAQLMRPWIAKAIPSQAAAVAGLGYIVPARVIPGTARIGPNMRAYLPRGSASPLLAGRGMGAYMRPGASAVLSGSAREREQGVIR